MLASCTISHEQLPNFQADM